MALAVAKSRGPSGIPARCPCPWMRLLERSSPEVQPSFTVTTRHPRPRITGSCSPGVFPPLQRIKHRRSTASTVARFSSPTPFPSRDSAGTSHFAGYGVALRLFQPLGDFFSPLPSHHFQAGNALGVLPFRGFPFHAAPYGSSPPACPPDVAPLVNRFRPKRKLPWARAAP
jgi:hypothetical protein